MTGLVFAKASAIATHAAERALPSVSRQLGFDIRFSRIDAQAFPVPSLLISDLVIGRSGEPPLLAAKTVQATVALWPLVRSLGGKVELKSATVDGATLAATRRADGTWNLLVLLEGLLRSQHDDAAPLVAHQVTVHATKFDLYDLTQTPEANGSISAIRAELDLDSSPTSPGRFLASTAGTQQPEAPASAVVRARAALGSDLPNLSTDITLRLGPPRSAGGPNTQDLRGTLSLEQMDLARTGWLVPASLRSLLKEGAFSAKLAITTSDAGIISASGEGALQRVSLLDLPAAVAFSIDAKLHTTDPGDLQLRLPSITIDRISASKLEVREVHAQADLRDATLHVDQGGGTFCGAPVSIDAVTLSPDSAWTLSGKVDGLSLVTLASTSGLSIPLSGILGARFDGAGAGMSWEAIRSSTAGSGRFDVREAHLGSEAIAALTRPIRNALSSAGLPPTLMTELGAVPTTMPIEPFGAAFRIADGQVRLVGPVLLRTSLVDVALTGHVGLDQTLSLAGSATLHPWGMGSPRNTDARGRTSEAVRGVPITVRGTLSNPVFEVSASPGQILSVLVDAAPTPRQIQDGALRQVRDWLRRR